MNRNRLFLRIFADGAGTFSGTCFGCGRLLCYRPIIESMVAHFSFLAAAAFLPVLGFILLPVAVAVLMFKHWNGFGLHIVADRAVTLSGTSLGFGGRLRLSPIAVDMVCHIQPFAAGAFLPVVGIVIFPCFIMDAVFMGGRSRLLSAAGIAADCPVAPFTPTCYRILAVWVTDNVNRPGPYFKRIRILRLSDILRIEKYPPVYLNAFCLEYLTVQYQLRLILKIRAA